MYCVIKCVKTKRVLKRKFASSVFHNCNKKNANLRDRSSKCTWQTMVMSGQYQATYAGSGAREPALTISTRRVSTDSSVSQHTTYSLYQLSYAGSTEDKILTYSMEQSPSWEAKRGLASQEIPRILWNPGTLYIHVNTQLISSRSLNLVCKIAVRNPKHTTHTRLHLQISRTLF
jgi:hypothetical protein